MRILIIADEEWNDYVYGNNVLTNWFTDFDADFAEIYASPGLPLNGVCNLYFRITDSEMVKSIFFGPKAGCKVTKPADESLIKASKQNPQRHGIYKLMKSISTTFSTSVQLLRDLIWLNGRYDKKALSIFVKDFNPDVVFCPRMITPKLMRLEKLVSTMTNAPFVAFTGDNEASLDNIKPYTLYGLRRKYIHCRFSNHVKLYSYYLMHSQDQADEYHIEYGIPTTTFFKCGDCPDNFIPKQVGSPIRMVYAGRLYCNRWKSLAEIGKALRIINQNCVRMVLDIYTQESLTSEQSSALSQDNYIYLKGSVAPDKLKQIYQEADIALHVESMDETYKYVTRVSFSTKIIDLMASSCAILAICWERHAGYQYLKQNDSAFCVTDYNDIFTQLSLICNNRTLITEYAKKAYGCGKHNHDRLNIQTKLRNVFEEAITNGFNSRL